MKLSRVLKLAARSIGGEASDLSAEVQQMLERMERRDLAAQLDGCEFARSTEAKHTCVLAEGARSYSIEMDVTSSVVVLDISADERVLAMHVMKPID